MSSYDTSRKRRLEEREIVETCSNIPSRPKLLKVKQDNLDHSESSKLSIYSHLMMASETLKKDSEEEKRVKSETLRGLDDLIDMIKLSFQHKEKDYFNLELAYDESLEKLEQSDEILTEAQEKIQELEQTLFERNKELSEIREKESESKEELREKEQELSELKESLWEIEEELSQIKETNGEIVEELSDMKETLGEKEEELSEMKETLGEKEGELSEIIETLGEKEKELSQIKETLGKKDGELSEIKEKLANMEGEEEESDENATFREHVESLRKKNESLRKGAETELTRKDEKIKSLQTLLTGFRTKVTEFDSLTKEKSVLNELLQKSDDRHKAEAEQITKLESKVTSMEKNLRKNDLEKRQLSEEYTRHYTALDYKLKKIVNTMNGKQLQIPLKPAIAVTPQIPVVLRKFEGSSILTIEKKPQSSINQVRPSTSTISSAANSTTISIRSLPRQLVSRSSLLSSEGDSDPLSTSNSTLEESISLNL